MKYVKFTEKRKQEREVWINLENVTHISPYKDGTKIWLQKPGLHCILVKESIAKVVTYLK